MQPTQGKRQIGTLVAAILILGVAVAIALLALRPTDEAAPQALSGPGQMADGSSAGSAAPANSDPSATASSAPSPGLEPLAGAESEAPGPESTATNRPTPTVTPAPRSPEERAHPCPPEGCDCAPGLCPTDEECQCRVDGSLRQSVSTEHTEDGFIIRRVTRYDAEGNPAETTEERSRDGVLLSRETTTYTDGEVDRRVRERFDESGGLRGRMEEQWRDGEARSWQRTRFGPDGEPVRSMQRELGDDGTHTMGFDRDGDGEIERWAVLDEDRAGQLFDAQGNAMGSWETEQDGDVDVRRRRDVDGQVVVEMRTTSDGSRHTTEVRDAEGNTERVMVRDEEAGTFDAYDETGNPVFHVSENEDGQRVAEARVEGIWFDMGAPRGGDTEFYGSDETGTSYRMQMQEEDGHFTLAEENADGDWVEVSSCAFEPDCPMARPPCPYTCE